jgi:hypothetical protein
MPAFFLFSPGRKACGTISVHVDNIDIESRNVAELTSGHRCVCVPMSCGETRCLPGCPHYVVHFVPVIQGVMRHSVGFCGGGLVTSMWANTMYRMHTSTGAPQWLPHDDATQLRGASPASIALTVRKMTWLTSSGSRWLARS